MRTEPLQTGWDEIANELEASGRKLDALEACGAFETGDALALLGDHGADAVGGVGEVGFLDKVLPLSADQSEDITQIR